jgi:hypothetical protein
VQGLRLLPQKRPLIHHLPRLIPQCNIRLRYNSSNTLWGIEIKLSWKGIMYLWG